MRIFSVALCFSMFTSGSAVAAPEPKDDSDQLTVQKIFGSRDYQTQRFGGRWLPKSNAYTVLEKSKAEPSAKDIVRYDAETGKSEVMVSASLLIPGGTTTPLAINNYSFSKDLSLVLIYTNSKRVWRRNTRGDYWILDRTSRQLRKIGRYHPESSLMFAKISPTGKHVAYVHERNIYIEDLFDHSTHALTETNSPTVINGTFDWVYEEELGLRDGFRWSPDGEAIAYWQLDAAGVRRVPLVNNTDSLYPKVTWIPYPKVGQRNSSCRVGVVQVAGGKTKWIKLPGDSREHYIARMDWAENAHELLLQQLNRLQNTNRVMLADVGKGTVKTLLTERDKAWVDVHDELHWFDGGKRFTWISERDGWRHVYLASRSGGKLKLATPGKFDVIQLLHVDEKDKQLYFIASPKDPGQRFLYSCRFDGSRLRRLTPSKADGTHSYSISPNGRWAIHTWSSFDAPPTTEMISLPDHKSVRTLKDNKKLADKLKKLKLGKTDFFKVKLDSGVELHAWSIRPPKYNSKKKYPLLVYVYGEPAGQTVVDRWGGSSLLWHHMLARKGYVIMSFDNRGSKAPRGRDWRKCIYRKVGILGPRDQADAVSTILKKWRSLDPKRVGIWGWSGGGSSTLHALFKYPEVYHTGISVAPVPNQRYYDTIYQERYMGLPGGNVEGFRDGSPITFAKNLKGNLLLIHGTGDDNCHYQTSEMLINELIRHNKPFQMMAYPNRTHSIREGKNTTLHLRALMTRYLLDKLPAGGK